MRALTGILLLFVSSFGSAKRVVSFRVHASEPQAPEFGNSKRDTISTRLVDVLDYYEISLSVGTPPQNISARIDTTSSDFWLVSPDNPYCHNATDSNIPDSNRTFCYNSMLFDREKSSTWNRNSSSTSEFHTVEWTGGVASGDYGQDNILIDGTMISQANFAVANASNCTYTVFGIGPRYAEAGVTLLGADRDAYTYDNIPIQMKRQGLISSVAYSLFLDHLDKGAGTLLFGGVDHAKYKGDLGIVPVLRYYVRDTNVQIKEPVNLAVMLHGIGIEDDAGNAQWLVECAISVAFDTSGRYSVIPNALVQPLVKALDAEYSDAVSGYAFYCETAGNIIFDFSGVHVKVPIGDMMGRPFAYSNQTFHDDYGNEICAFGITNGTEVPDSGHTYIIGTSVLRALYVVYDLDNWEIGIATADLESESEDIEEITDGIPGSSAPSYSATSFASNYSTAQEITVYPTAPNVNTSYISQSRWSLEYTSTNIWDSSGRSRTGTQTLGVKSGGIRPSSAQDSSTDPSPTAAVSSGSSQPISGSSEAASPSSGGSVAVNAANLLWLGILAYLI